MSAITIKELTNEVSTSAGISLFGLITSSLHSGNDVVVKNFGRFYNHTRPARKGRNPMTGAAIDIQAKTIIKLAPRGDLK
jgi:nucleoid DNA-binding protein